MLCCRWLDNVDTLMAATGHQAEAERMDAIEKCWDNPPLNEDGLYCIVGGKPSVEQTQMAAENGKAIIRWGACASYGCVPSAPNPAVMVRESVFAGVWLVEGAGIDRFPTCR
jgi:hydrogenase small subunit